MKRWWLLVAIASALVFVLVLVVIVSTPVAQPDLTAALPYAVTAALVVLLTGGILSRWQDSGAGVGAPALQHVGAELLQQDGVAIFITDNRGDIRHWNPGAARLFGHDREQVQGMNALSLFPDSQRQPVQELLRARPPLSTRELELQALRTDGQAFDVQISVLNMGSAGPDGGLIWHARDITARKQLERTVRQVLDAGYGRSASEFLHFLTEQLAQTLGTQFAFISRFNDDGRTARMIALWDGQQLHPPFDYSVAESPCAELRHRDLVCYADQVARRFPQDHFLRQHDVHAYLAVALFDARGEPLGQMGVMNGQPIQKVEHSATVLRIFSSRAAAELQRMQADESLAHRVAMETLLADVSSGFVGVQSSDFDAQVQAALEQLGTFAGVERCHLYRLSADQAAATLTHLWSAPQVESVPESYREVTNAAYPWHWQEMRNRGFVLIPDVDALPQEAAAERTEMKRAGIRSMLEVGIYEDGRLSGFLGLESLQRVIRWPPEDLRMLRVVSEVLANAFERRRAEQTLRKLSSALDQAADAVMITDRRGVIEYVNPAFVHISGYSRAEALGRTPSLLRSGRHDPAYYQDMWATVLRGEVFRGTLINRRRDGTLYHEQKTITPLKDQHGAITHFIATGRDISEQVQAQEHLLHLAHHDALTDLPNRSLFMDRTEHAIARARRSGSQVGLLFLDLDGFKEINDSLGHDAGDQLLRLVADRLRAAVRQGDTVSRLGGDEFTILIEGIERPDNASAVADKIVDSLAQPFSIAGAIRHIAASIGISIYPTDGEQPEALLTQADKAMFEAKREAPGSFRFAGSSGRN